MADVDTSLYPKSSAGSMGPAQMIDLMRSIQTLQSQRAITDEARKSINPNSPVGMNMSQFLGGLRDNPNITLGMPEAVWQGQALQGQGQNLAASQTKMFSDFAGSLLGQKDGLSDRNMSALYLLGLKNGIHPEIMKQIVPSNLPRSQKERADILTRALGINMGVAGTQPTVPTVTQTGENAGQPRNISPIEAGSTNAPALPPQAGQSPTGQPTAMRPGFSEAQGMEAKSGQELAQRIDTAGTEAMNRLTNLHLLKTDLKIAGVSGPTVRLEKSASVVAQRLGLNGITMSPEQVSALESFDKVANTMAQQQAAAFHPTDLGQRTAFGANPHLDLSKMGNDGLIDMLLGNEHAIVVKRQAMRQARESGVAPDKIQQWENNFNKSFDPRVFQFANLPPDKRKVFLEAMDERDRKNFALRLREAQSKGWVNPAAQ